MRRLVAVALPVLLIACGGDDEEPLATGPLAPAFVFTESAVAEGEPIDPRYTCDGEDLSPALAWEDVPEGTAELAILVEDPDAPGGVFTHWLGYGLDPEESALPENVPEGDEVKGPPALRQGENDMGTIGYSGPCPPGGETHRYVFRVVALDATLDLEGGASRSQFLEAVAGHLNGEATLTATYSRS
jgi:Raf kinase inhibitor-like YbhB/YbcL family protein